MQSQLGELGQTLRCKALHARRVVMSRHRGDQSRCRHVALQAHRLPRRAEADLHLRADGHPAEIPPQRLDNERVGLVAAVVAHPLPQQAGGNADANWRNRGLRLIHHDCLSLAPGKAAVWQAADPSAMMSALLKALISGTDANRASQGGEA